ncbi:MAG: hypothetical protein R2746_17940 [Acidimicrobiales bacterium]
MAGHERQHLSLPAGADPDRRVRRLHGAGVQRGAVELPVLAVEREPVGGEEALDDGEGLVEHLDAGAGGRERDAEGAVLGLEPGGAEGEVEPAVGGVVDGHGLGGEDRRVAVGHPGHEQAEAHPLGAAAERGEGGVALEALAGALAVHGLEVVEAPDAGEALLLGEPGAGDHLVEGHALLGDVESDVHGHSQPRPPATCTGRRSLRRHGQQG